MARTINEIYNELVFEKETFTTLDNLLPNGQIDPTQELLDEVQTTSKVGVWRLILWVVAVGIFTLENLFDVFKADVEALSKTLVTGTVRWLAEEALKFQLGDSLVFIDGVYIYSVIDESKQIVKRSAVEELVDGRVLLKVAKLDVNGDPEKLSVSELSSFTAYISQIKAAGVLVVTLSNDPDNLTVNYRVYVDTLKIDLTGESISTPAEFPVEDAINAFISDLPFGSGPLSGSGVLNITQLTDAMQEVDGVADPVYESSSAGAFGAGSMPFTDNYTPEAGYLNIDPATPLSATITYLNAEDI